MLTGWYRTVSRSFSKYRTDHPPRFQQRNTFLAANRLCFSLGIAGDQRAAGAGSGFGFAKDANPFANVFFEFVLSMKPSI
jgi:hypothetical protein